MRSHSLMRGTECNVVTITWLVDGYPIITEVRKGGDEERED